MSDTKPDPGSRDAILAGCECPAKPFQPAPSKSGAIQYGRYFDKFVYRDWMCVVKSCPMHGWGG